MNLQIEIYPAELWFWLFHLPFVCFSNTLKNKETNPQKSSDKRQ